MDDATKDQVCDLYKVGTKLGDITAQTGVPRPSIFWILEQRGIKPNRTKQRSEEVNVGQVLEQLSAAQREVGRLQEALNRQQALNEALLDKLRGS